jgi:hypothetical protein
VNYEEFWKMRLGRTTLITQFEKNKMAQKENVIAIKKNEVIKLGGTRMVKRGRGKVMKSDADHTW